MPIVIGLLSKFYKKIQGSVMHRLNNKKTNLWLFTLITFQYLSCEECPPNQYIGNVSFSPKSHQFVPYLGSETLIFTDSLDNEMSLNSKEGLIDTAWFPCVFKPCAKGWFGETCHFIEMEKKEIQFHNDSIKIWMGLYFQYTRVMNPVEEIDTNWIETFGITVYDLINHTPSENLRIITNMRGKKFLTIQDSTYHTNSILKDKLQIIDSTFNNVYTNEQSIWMNEAAGIVGFIYQGKKYELSRIE